MNNHYETIKSERTFFR